MISYKEKINRDLGEFLILKAPDNSAVGFAKYLIEKEPQSEPQSEPPTKLPLIESILLILEDRKNRGTQLKKIIELTKAKPTDVSNALTRGKDKFGIVQIPKQRGGAYFLSKHVSLIAPPVQAPPVQAPPKIKPKKSKRKIEGTSAQNEAMRFFLERPNSPTTHIETQNRLEKITYKPKSTEHVLVNLSDRGLIDWNRNESKVTLTEKGKVYDPGIMPLEVKERLAK